ncbi:MarR family transcriptional regulator [Kribbella sp. NPDC023855]|uniref:MarR family winged helix-turn-helix transcriptional regulator n=1 Tax=Kribbella sp. NPDC023855 TaxID=3154698 RepID=UPI0033FD8E9B
MRSGGANPSDLAPSSLITTGAMASRLNRLEEAGLIRRTPDSEDGRAIHVHLTASGRSLAKRSLTKVLAVDEEFLSPLTAGQRRQVATLLRELLISRRGLISSLDPDPLTRGRWGGWWGTRLFGGGLSRRGVGALAGWACW